MAAAAAAAASTPLELAYRLGSTSFHGPERGNRSSSTFTGGSGRSGCATWRPHHAREGGGAEDRAAAPGSELSASK